MSVEADDKQQKEEKHNAPRKPLTASRMKGEPLRGGSGSEGFSAANDARAVVDPQSAAHSDEEQIEIMPRLMPSEISPQMAGVLNGWVSDAAPSPEGLVDARKAESREPSPWEMAHYAQHASKAPVTPGPHSNQDAVEQSTAALDPVQDTEASGASANADHAPDASQFPCSGRGSST